LGFQVDVKFLLMAVLFFLYVTKGDRLASENPTYDVNGYIGDQHHILRFAVITMIFVPLSIFLWFFEILIYARFIEDKLGQFTDFCALSNISVFILEQAISGCVARRVSCLNFYKVTFVCMSRFYIHGRSVHGFADVSLWELRNQMRKEGADLTGHRGLEANSDQQTFEIFVQPALRQQLNAVLSHALESDTQVCLFVCARKL
jgi:meckelin